MNEYLKTYQQNKDRNKFPDFNFRDELVKKYSWAIPDDEALQKLVEYSPIIEIGAGNGYWAYEATKLGADIIPIELNIGDKNDYGNCKPWITLQQGDHNKILEYPERNLFLCWPCYDASWAFESLKLFTGKYLLYIGEDFGGCTGDDRFHEKLEKDFKLIEVIIIPKFYSTHDSFFIYKNNNYKEKQNGNY